MRRLLVLSGLTLAIVTIPALASDGSAGPPHSAIGSVSAGQDGARAADYWTSAHMVAAVDLTMLVLPGDGSDVPAAQAGYVA